MYCHMPAQITILLCHAINFLHPLKVNVEERVMTCLQKMNMGTNQMFLGKLSDCRCNHIFG